MDSSGTIELRTVLNRQGNKVQVMVLAQPKQTLTNTTWAREPYSLVAVGCQIKFLVGQLAKVLANYGNYSWVFVVRCGSGTAPLKYYRVDIMPPGVSVSRHNKLFENLPFPVLY